MASSGNEMSPSRSHNWLNLVSGLLAWLPGFAACLWLMDASTRSGLPFLYALDDAYIHMALARTLDELGLYGLTRHEWSAPSSSFLWPFMLVGLRSMGITEYGPLALNLVASLGLSIALCYGLRYLMPDLSAIKQISTVTLILLIAPMPALVLGEWNISGTVCFA
jgi:hypothetical protein